MYLDAEALHHSLDAAAPQEACQTPQDKTFQKPNTPVRKG